jgi:hypothetical protein
MVLEMQRFETYKRNAVAQEMLTVGRNFLSTLRESISCVSWSFHWR